MAISNNRVAFLTSPYDGIAVDADAVTALGLVTAGTEIRVVLDILCDAVARNRVTAVDSIGYATSVQN
ncbi:hypothetical protein S-CBP2_0050 [Synechococcus phage S-CBP2]|uniref:Uncharacterized protein n=1 Tax=Synechococcus phage S-CBP2 TaxID=756277 RepID=A0A096VL27_9CAUD|nr:hypothetical protein S-CBP2_0050 [Synechococcus phage S-CBP2]AGF91067.1 hypothetical protein SXHG_00045 [Synechococcus phage MRHenn-2013a]AGK86756.1 hypothetical protein S-CBP2_0050 [Synechococcus phage S-CBP2]